MISQQKKTRSPKAIQRLYEAAGCNTQQKLAIFLNIRQSSIAEAKKRNSIPAEWLLKLLRKKGIIRTGYSMGKERDTLKYAKTHRKFAGL